MNVPNILCSGTLGILIYTLLFQTKMGWIEMVVLVLFPVKFVEKQTQNIYKGGFAWKIFALK